MNSERAALGFHDVHKRFGRRPVLTGLTLEVPAGAFFGLVGLNGAGKTTCIKGALDFTAIDRGRIEIFGVPHVENRARAALGFLPERFLPPYYLTGRDFLRYMARLHERPFDEAGAGALCESLDLAREALDRPAREYSKGMAQKLGLIAMFQSRRELLILDEPMSGLDPKARVLVKRYLLGLKGRGFTVFFSTHHLGDVEELCDTMGVLHDGSLRFVGTPRECEERFGAPRLEEAFLRSIA